MSAIAEDARPITSFDVLSGKSSIAKAAVRTLVPNLSIVPANSDLVGLEAGDDGGRQPAIPPARRRHRVDRRAARPADEVPYNYLLIDCPPSLNLLTLNAMVAAHAVLVPVQCEFFALEGISQLKETIDQIKATLNPGLEIQGVVLTMHDCAHGPVQGGRDRGAGLLRPQGLRDHDPRATCKVAEAPSHGKPILLYDYDCPGSQAYIRLATEIIERERQLRAA